MQKIGPVECINSNFSGVRYEKWDDKGRSQLVGFHISYSDSVVTAVQFLYAENGNIVSSHDTDSFTGPKFRKIEFNYPSEYLTSVTGSYETSYPRLIFTSIAFGTNKANYGPFGRTNFGEDQKSPLRFDWDWGPHNVFCGFYGKYHGSSLQAIGVYIKPTLSLGKQTPEPFRF